MESVGRILWLELKDDYLSRWTREPFTESGKRGDEKSPNP